MINTISTVVSTHLRFRRLTLAVCLLLPVAAHGQTITKCQDEDGNWHYGDFAAEICSEKSSITEIDERGIKVRESEAPPTSEELQEQEAAKKEQEMEAEREARETEQEERLLRTYDNAQSIINARDERVAALERDLESYRLFRQDLVEEKNSLENNAANEDRIAELDQQIRQYDEAIRSLKEEQQETTQEFNRELEIYRELTNADEEQPETGE